MEASTEKIVDIDVGEASSSSVPETPATPAPEANLAATFEATAMQDEKELGKSPDPQVATEAAKDVTMPEVTTPPPGASHQSPDPGRVSSGQATAADISSPSSFSHVSAQIPQASQTQAGMDQTSQM